MDYLRGALDSTLGAPIAKAILALIVTITGPWGAIQTAALVLLVADMLTGIVRSVYEETFSATYLGKKTATKLILYGLMFSMAYHIGQIGVAAEEFPLHNIFDLHRMLALFVASWIAVTEWESVGRNIRRTGGRWPSITSLIELVFRLKEKTKGGKP